MRQIQTRPRPGYSLIELVVSMGSATMLLVGLASTIFISSRALDGNSALKKRTDASAVLGDVVSDMSHAIRFSERTANAVTFTVPDRDGDTRPDTIRYAWSGTPGDPLMYSFDGEPEVAIADDVQTFNLTFLTRFMAGGLPPGQQGLRVLLVVSDAGSPTTQESIRRVMIEGWGFSVSLIDDSEGQTSFDSAVAQNDVAYVPREVSGVTLGTKLREAAIGVVNEDWELLDEFGFAAMHGNPSDTSVDIHDNTHYITDGFSTGSLALVTTAQRLVYLAGSISPDVFLLGEIGGKPAFALLATGKILEGGGTAAGRRVQLPWAGEYFDINLLTPEGQTIMRRAIEWASGLGADGGPIPLANFGYETQFATNVPESAKVQIATQVVLPENGTLESITAYLTGVNGKKYGFALYSDAGGEPGNLIVQSGTGNGGGTGWKTLSVTATPLNANTFWLALCLEHASHHHFRENSGGQIRVKFNDAIKYGFTESWGSSNGSYPYKVSIYGTYTPSQ